jgi:hypothetical protein
MQACVVGLRMQACMSLWQAGALANAMVFFFTVGHHFLQTGPHSPPLAWDSNRIPCCAVSSCNKLQKWVCRGAVPAWCAQASRHHKVCTGQWHQQSPPGFAWTPGCQSSTMLVLAGADTQACVLSASVFLCKVQHTCVCICMCHQPASVPALPGTAGCHVEGPAQRTCRLDMWCSSRCTDLQFPAPSVLVCTDAALLACVCMPHRVCLLLLKTG